MAYHSIEAILDYCEKRGKKFYEAVLEDDMEERKVSREESIKEMYVMWDAMLLASTSYDGSARSASGLAGGQGAARGRPWRSTGRREIPCAGII